MTDTWDSAKDQVAEATTTWTVKGKEVSETEDKRYHENQAKETRRAELTMQRNSPCLHRSLGQSTAQCCW